VSKDSNELNPFIRHGPNTASPGWRDASACRRDSVASEDRQMSTSDGRLLDILRLNLIPGVGPRTHQILLEHFGSAENILSAKIIELQQLPGIGPKVAKAISSARSAVDAESELQACREAGIQLIARDSDDYPRPLLEIPDPPAILYCKGTVREQDELAIGMVGSRRCTVYGRQQAERLAGALARAGVTIVSGLARGIDAVAHRAALAANGRTFAVTASGLNNIYPPEHAELAQQVSESGAMLCESKLQQRPASGLFPQRNRIISGLSIAIIVVEAARNSGALHTARHAMEQGREVMAVPGRVDSLASEGCHDLIRDGVTLIRNVDDVMESLGPLVNPVKSDDKGEIHSLRELSLNEREREVLNLITNDPQHIDEVLRATDIEPSRVLATLTVLEMKRMIRRLPGSMLIRATN